MVKTPDTQEFQRRVFTKEQVAEAKAKLEANPELLKKLFSSAQSGNEDDLRFLLDVGLDNLRILGSEKEGDWGIISTNVK